MEKIKRTLIRTVILFFICFACTSIIFFRWRILENIHCLQDLQIKDSQIINKIKIVVSFIGSFLVANGVNLLKIYMDSRKETMMKTSKVNILIRDITCIRKTRRKDGFPEVVLGKGKQFVYVISVLKNSGENAIVECSMNGEKMEIGSIEKNELYDFYFRVCREKDELFRKEYAINIEFKDDQDRYYEKSMVLQMNEEKRSARMISKGKQRRKHQK